MKEKRVETFSTLINFGGIKTYSCTQFSIYSIIYALLIYRDIISQRKNELTRQPLHKQKSHFHILNIDS